MRALSGKVPCVTYSNLHFTDRREVLLVPSLRDRKNFRRVQHRPDFVGQVPDPLCRLSATSVADRLGQAIDLGQRMFRRSKILANAAKSSLRIIRSAIRLAADGNRRTAASCAEFIPVTDR